MSVLNARNVLTAKLLVHGNSWQICCESAECNNLVCGVQGRRVPTGTVKKGAADLQWQELLQVVHTQCIACAM
jgi:hypothetical protein